ncbi:MAG: 23S rRNA (pseudouridine(1915)-N(3))-methyltransferase RlmH [Alicyclobacillus sp.]|nr:23S rRNA (pseudouridine(1915)-N(3))-methyltransferase RlmH [Alicyclobacillus sp.]
MRVLVAAVGKLKERYWQQALAEYAKRLSRYMQLELVEVADEPVPEHAPEAVRRAILKTEGERLTRLLRDRDGVIALDRQGTMYDSEAWSRKYDALQSAGYSRLVFLIGGSLGLDASLLSRSVCSWSFGPLTLPHALARIVLLEQLYRGVRILNGEPYHK